MLLAFACALALTPATARAAEGETKPIMACTAEAVAGAVAEGGSYEFVCSGQIALPDQLLVTKDVSLEVDPLVYGVTLIAAPDKRVFKVEGGTLTLDWLGVVGGKLALARRQCDEAVGGAGCPGADGEYGGVRDAPSASGGSGTPGRNGTAGVAGEAMKGGCIYIAEGAAAVIRSGVIRKCSVVGQSGQDGGHGGYGGGGGRGMPGETTPCPERGPTSAHAGGEGGDGGAGSGGGDGANAGAGGDGLGGAIYNEGTLNVTNTLFMENTATGGYGGRGGFGGGAGSAGWGGNGSDGVVCVEDTSPPPEPPPPGGGARTAGASAAADDPPPDEPQPEAPGGNGGRGGSCSGRAGHGGRGGNGGDGKGGAIYNAGRATIAGATFSSNVATGVGARERDPYEGYGDEVAINASRGGGGGGGCRGGSGGNGGRGSGGIHGEGGDGGNGADGGDSANIGDAGDGMGGAVYNGGVMDPPTSIRSNDNKVAAGQAWNRCDPRPDPDKCPALLGGPAGPHGGGGGYGGNYPQLDLFYPGGRSGTDGRPGADARGGKDGVALDPDVRSIPVEPPEAAFAYAPDDAKLYKIDFDARASKVGEGGDGGARGRLTGFAWSFGDGKTSTGIRPSHTYAKPGRFKVRLTVTDNYGQQATSTKTVEVKPKLEVTLKATPSKIEVKQKDKGPEPVKVALTVTVRNPNPVTLRDVTLPEKVDIALPDEPEATKKALKQESGPTKRVKGKLVPDLDIGTLKKKESETRTYTLVLRGDGDYEVSALVTGSDPDGIGVRGIGKTDVGGTTPLLFFGAKRGTFVRGQSHRDWVKAGTTFLMRVKLQNRSYTKRLLVYPIYAKLSGNGADGHMQDVGLNVRRFTSRGSIAEVRPSKYIELAPRAKREYDVVVRTSAADSWATQEDDERLGGGSRATVEFDKPELGTVSLDKKVTKISRKNVVMGKDSELFRVPVDDSVPPQPKQEDWESTYYITRGIVIGLWNVTYGPIRGVFDLSLLAAKTVIEAPGRVLAYINHEIELWYAIRDDPYLRAQYINAVLDKTATVFEDAEYISSVPVIGAALLYQQVDAAVGAKYKNIAQEYYDGDWRGAMEQMSTETTERFVDVATALAPSVLARMPATRAKWQAVTAATYARTIEALNATIREVTGVHAALAALRGIVRPGLIYTNKMLAKLYGLRPVEAEWLRDFTQNFRTKLGNRISIVIRSRAEEAIEWIDKHGALLKPAWIKLKNVNWIDAQYLGYDAKDVGRLILRHPPAWDDVIAKLRANNVRTGSAEFEGVRLRWEQRNKEWFNGDRTELFDWHRKGEVEGKWPWEENGVDPTVQADEVDTRGFRLQKTGRPGEYAVEIRVKGSPDPGDWRSVTGDIDIIAITRADGRALTDAEHVEVLKAIRGGPMGASHPESATWIKKGEFWFPAKEAYLNNDGKCCLAQFAADGNARAVEFNKNFSEFVDRGKHNFRIWWNGGLQAP